MGDRSPDLTGAKYHTHWTDGMFRAKLLKEVDGIADARRVTDAEPELILNLALLRIHDRSWLGPAE